ncbi:MAG: enoyl-CoA hydratase/isomerase family protein [Synergistetes bacterium]|nr:enoyl-CoA hydratase/isomerase family protein [Synergistota bacterium]MCX8127138.1 enoyl-CoA hydratase/isomerase family protein [Synergistota bacterium]MDW8191976.1 enoyl-CoA hydratase/isomerase family protein [Synergistota bacterium]
MEILIERKDALAFIVLNRPEAMNTFNSSLAIQLNQALVEFDKDPGIRVIIIKAQGKNFSAGIDLNEFLNKDSRELRSFIKLMELHSHTIANMKKPVVASVRGYVLANGAGLMMASDFAVASENAKIGTTAIKVGLACIGPGVIALRCLGRKRALEMVLLGEWIDAHEAYRLGLVNRVVPDESLEEETEKFALSLAEKNPFAIELAKRGLYASEDLPYHEALSYAGELFTLLAQTEDAKEGIRAFFEKRKPVWRGR